MNSKKIKCALAGFSLAALAGCAHVPDRGHLIEAQEQVSRVDRHGSFPAVRRIYFEQVNLVEMIDPHGLASTRYPAAWKTAEALRDERKWGLQYDLVLAAFRESSLPERAKTQHRNSVQDKILAVATSRCNVFKTFLRRQQTDVNFMLGTATTAAGVLGAVLNGVNASRNLAGVAGLLSGIQAEYNQAYYNNLAAHVIVQGIEMLQSRLQKDLIEGRKSLSTTAYSMEAAINDAIFIDGSCSTVAGLHEASESISQVSNPGLAFASKVIASSKALREIEQGSIGELMESGRLDQLLKRASPANAPLIATLSKKGAQDSADAAITNAVGAKARSLANVQRVAMDLAKVFEAAQQKIEQSSRSLKSESDIHARSLKVEALFGELALAAVPKLPYDTCAAALENPTRELASAQAAHLLAGVDDVKRIKANQEIQLAGANSYAVAAKLELLVNAAQHGTQANADRWVRQFTKNNPSDEELKKSFREADFNLEVFKGLCN